MEVNGHKNLVPRCVRSRLVDMAHSPHLSGEAIWATVGEVWILKSLNNDFKVNYRDCQTCREHKVSKPRQEADNLATMELLEWREWICLKFEEGITFSWWTR